MQRKIIYFFNIRKIGISLTFSPSDMNFSLVALYTIMNLYNNLPQRKESLHTLMWWKQLKIISKHKMNYLSYSLPISYLVCRRWTWMLLMQNYTKMSLCLNSLTVVKGIKVDHLELAQLLPLRWANMRFCLTLKYLQRKITCN